MSFARHTASSFVAFGLPLAVGLIAVPFYLRLLGPELYGALILFLAALNFAGLLDLGAGKAAAFRIARADRRSSQPDEETAASGMALCLLVCLPILAAIILARDALAPLLPLPAGATLSDMSLALVLGALAIPLVAIMNVLVGVFQGQLRFFQLNAIQAGGGIAMQLFPLMACWLIAPTLPVAIAAVLGARAVQTLVMVRWRRDRANSAPPSLRPRLAVMLDMLRYGRWPALQFMLASVLTLGDRFIVSHLGGPAQVTAYAVPFDLANRLMIVAGSVANTLFPSLAGDAGDAPRKTRLAVHSVIALLTPICIAICLALDPFLRLWIGSELAEAGRMVGELILVGVWATAVTAVVQARLMAMARASALAASYAVQLPLFFLAIYAAYGAFGLVGVAAVWAARCYVDAVAAMAMAGDGFAVLRDLAPHAVLLAGALAISALDLPVAARLSALLVIGGASLVLSRGTIVLVVTRLRHG